MAPRAVLLVALLVAPAAGAFLKTQRCGPQTKIFKSTSTDAAGTAQFDEVPGIVDGTCVGVGTETVTAIKFCGPGTLTLSRMTCERHDYKAHEVVHSASEYTTNCETISATDTVVEGWLGSFTVKC